MIDGHLNARDQLIARIYKELRIEDEANPLKGESLKLYNEIKKALIGVTENVYNFKLVLEVINHIVEEALHELGNSLLVVFT